ncbi:MAG: glycine cleavage system protein R [Shewanella sp.]
MTNYLVVTAMGADRPGLVSKLSRLAADCDCDIIDSRMALFGNEFTLIMMMAGSWGAITKIESSLPELSVQLDLLTIMKRTSKHIPQNYVSRIEVNFQGKDERGSIKRITEFLAERGLDIASLRSCSDSDTGNVTQKMSLAINIPEKVELDKLESQLQLLAQEMSLTLTIKRMQGN